MLKRPLQILLSLAGFVLSMTPASAVTNGQPDAAVHPAVGLVYQTLGADACNPVSKLVGCSSVLVAPDVLVVEGRCAEGLLFNVQNGFVDRTWVILDALPLDPNQSVPTLDCAKLIAVSQIQWDRASNTGVMILAEPQPSIAPARLPAPGDVRRAPRKPSGLTVVGFGALADPNDVYNTTDYTTFSRRFATARLGAVNSNVHEATLEPRPDGVQPCLAYLSDFGPAYISGTNEVISLATGSLSCITRTDFQRLDTPSARAFLGNYVTLP